MRLGTLIRKYRALEELTVRELAHEIGIGFQTLSRLENGERIDAVNLMKVFNWLVDQPAADQNNGA